MFTSQKLLGILLIMFVIGAGIYFTISKFKQDVRQASASPSPSPVTLDLVFNKSPQPSDGQSQSNPSELPLSKIKKLSQFPGPLSPEILQNKKALIKTAKGVIELEIYPEATMAASNFLILSSNGFYDGLTFHRVEDWVVQGGDPEGTGRGGPGYQFPDEPVAREYVRGIVAMANAGPDTNGSQFFILKKDTPLPPSYTIFGFVTSGLEVVDKLVIGDVMQKVVIQNFR